ncbi:MAG: LON peptidase substrate-binding domain-containing protein [Proteobacteria bacterium]|nr:LON peptidase substrate-binding domain-containing protein [Pseudomonadota bacterium]
MTRGAFQPDFDDLPRVVPIFPLPGVLLLPGGRLPLNIFEPRYLAMVRDALSGERTIGMIQPCAEAPDVGAARVYETGCAGRITAFSETDDGRYLITLTGAIRFDVERELPPIEGYRRVVADYGRFRGDLEEEASEIDRERFLETLGCYFEANGIEGDWTAIEEAGDAALVTSLAMICPFAAPEKQALLEAMSLPERARTMTAIMEMAVHEPGGATH